MMLFRRPRWPARRSFSGSWPAGLTVTLAAAFLFLPTAAQAASLYWVGAAGGNTSVASNWLTTNPTACGGGNASAAPGSADIATPRRAPRDAAGAGRAFDPDVPRIMATQSVRGCDNNATIDANWSVAGMDVQSSHTGVVVYEGSAFNARLYT